MQKHSSSETKFFYSGGTEDLCGALEPRRTNFNRITTAEYILIESV